MKWLRRIGAAGHARVGRPVEDLFGNKESNEK
jgi:hypothetical protein